MAPMTRRCKILSLCLLVTFSLISIFYGSNIQNDVTFGADTIPYKYKPANSPANKSVVYIKVEKTGSSSFARIFKSYALRNKLHMILPRVDGYPGLINVRELRPGLSWDIVPDRRQSPKISFSHHRYHSTFFDQYFPPGNSVYVTSIRDPVKWFISYVDYNPLYSKMGVNPRTVLHRDKLFYKRRNWVCQMQTHVHNNFLQWLGFPMNPGYVYNKTDILHYIEFIDRKFSLIMITEYFYESVVLLRRIMKWSMQDIFFGFVNEAYKRSGVKFDEDEKTKLLSESHNRGDWLLYQHFNRTLWMKIAQQPDFYEELDVFKQLNQRVVEFCNSEELKRDETKKLILSTRWEPYIQIDGARCVAIRGPNIRGDFDELEQVLRQYSNIQKPTKIAELNLKQYHGMSWPPED